MAPIGQLVGKVEFSRLFLSLDGKSYDSLDAAKAVHAATLNYGIFLNSREFSHCGVLCVPGGAAGQSLGQEPCCGGCSRDERGPTLRPDHPDCGKAEPPPHFAARPDPLKI